MRVCGIAVRWGVLCRHSRPPGTLLLNMLIKNEAGHLDRTLPKWAKIIDYWIVGVDDANTDNSEEVIRKHLGHIPGEIVIVHFDGMGPVRARMKNIASYLVASRLQAHAGPSPPHLGPWSSSACVLTILHLRRGPNWSTWV
jgi:hypothetical protein